MTPNDFIISPNFTGLLSVKGADAFSFLQNIITNDLKLLESQDMVHACLLTPQGKYLHDFYVRTHDGGYAIACEGESRMDDMVKRLNIYKLRADVEIKPWILQGDGWVGHDDPEYKVWDKNRISESRPDGQRDAEIGASTLAELNLDISTVSYTKGCFVGQELVAKMHNRNLGKKHLVGIEFFDAPPAYGAEINNIGFMRSSSDNFGLILMQREAEENIKQGKITDAPFRLLGL